MIIWGRVYLYLREKRCTVLKGDEGMLFKGLGDCILSKKGTPKIAFWCAFLIG